jgi:hypothetical protein
MMLKSLIICLYLTNTDTLHRTDSIMICNFHLQIFDTAPGTHWIGGWVGPRAILDVVVKRKIPSPCQELNPRTPTVQPIAQRYTN